MLPTPPSQTPSVGSSLGPRPSALRWIVERLAMLLFGLALALGMLEVAFRIAGVSGPAELDPTFDRRFHRYLPGVARTNAWAQMSEGEVLRIAFVGDSFTIGEANTWDDVYTWRLERLLNLNEGVTPVEVRVFARKGTSTSEQVRFLAQALEWRADLVILGIFLNDPEDPTGSRRLEWRERMLPRPLAGWRGRLCTASHFCGWVYQRLEIRRTRGEQLDHLRYLYDREYSGWKKLEDALHTFQESTTNHGAGLVAVIFPVMAGLEGEYPQEFAHLQLREALETEDIPYHDLLEDFRGKSSLRMAAFPGIDAHPSEIAYRIAAHSIFEYLLAEGHVDRAYRPRNVYSDKSEERWLRQTRRVRSVLYPGESE